MIDGWLQITEEEAQQMERLVEIDGKSRQVEELRGRRKLKNSFEYEVKWRNIHEKHNSWIPREKYEPLYDSCIVCGEGVLVISSG